MWIGEKIQSTLADWPNVTSAVLDARNNLVRFTLAKSILGTGLVQGYSQDLEPPYTEVGGGRDVVFDLTLNDWQSVDDKTGTTSRRGLAGCLRSVEQAAPIDTHGSARTACSTSSPTLTSTTETWMTMSVETGWFKAAGIQGQQQVNRLLAMMRMNTGADISIALGYNYNESYESATTWTRAQIDTLLGSQPITRLRHDPSDNADGMAVRARITDAQPSTGSVDSGRGLTWIALTLDISPKDGPADVPEDLVMGKGIGGFVSGLFGSENDAKSKGRQVNSQNYNYGGSETGAEDQAKFYTQQGDQAQNRQATQAEKVNIDYSQAQADRTRGMQARQQQTSLANIMQQRARLVARRPSRRCRPIARCSRRRRCRHRRRAALAARADSRRRSATRRSTRRTWPATSAARRRSTQRASVRDDTNAAAGMWSNVRGGDLASQGQAAGQAQAQAQLGAQQNQFNAGLRRYAERAQRRAAALVRPARESGPHHAARGAYELRGAAERERPRRAGHQRADRQPERGDEPEEQRRRREHARKGAGIIAGALAKGGPAHAEKAYLVGEEGPELVVPRDDGYVLTAGQTKRALAHSPSSTINRLSTAAISTRAPCRSRRSMGARMCGGPVQARARTVARSTASPRIPWRRRPPSRRPDTSRPCRRGARVSRTATAYSWQAAQDQQARMQPYDDLSARIADQRQQIGRDAGSRQQHGRRHRREGQERGLGERLQGSPPPEDDAGRGRCRRGGALPPRPRQEAGAHRCESEAQEEPVRCAQRVG